MQDDPAARKMNPACIIYANTPAYIPILDERVVEAGLA